MSKSTRRSHSSGRSTSSDRSNTSSRAGAKNRKGGRSGYRKPSNNLQGGTLSSQDSGQSNPFVELEIDSLSYDGKGIGRLNGRACFVPMSLPGEKVKAQITAANNKRVEAKLIKVLEASEHRVAPACPVYDQCGGCDLQHLAHSAQLQHKQSLVEQMLKRTTGIESVIWNDPLVSEPSGLSYRRKIRLACHYDASQQRLSVGFRAAKSKKIVPVSECVIVSPEMKVLLSGLYELIEGLHSEANKPSILKNIAHIECVADQDGQSVCFRLMDELPDSMERTILSWAEQSGVNLWFRVGSEPLKQQQGETVYSTLPDGVKIAYSPEDFLQVNTEVNRKMVSAVIDALELKPTDRVLDFFSGLGNFTLPVAKKAGQVLAIEVIDEMVQKSLTNAKNNQLDNVDAVARDLFDTSALEWLDQGADKVILDPPRAGAELISQQLGRTQAKRVAYVSCNPQSLARDAQYILQQGYRLECLTLLDMFPQTSHVETLAIFSK